MVHLFVLRKHGTNICTFFWRWVSIHRKVSYNVRILGGNMLDLPTIHFPPDQISKLRRVRIPKGILLLAPLYLCLFCTCMLCISLPELNTSIVLGYRNKGSRIQTLLILRFKESAFFVLLSITLWLLTIFTVNVSNDSFIVMKRRGRTIWLNLWLWSIKEYDSRMISLGTNFISPAWWWIRGMSNLMFATVIF